MLLRCSSKTNVVSVLRQEASVCCLAHGFGACKMMGCFASVLQPLAKNLPASGISF